MASDEELKRTYNLFTDCWRLFRKCADVKDSDEYWDSVVSESDSIAKKYDNCRSVRDLLLAAINELERKVKEIRKNADTAI